eukprot:Blabericola_migrator_1__3195@NODE_193_length_11571_cov_33_434805_g166_i0_p1_GENE_NODE_193_length_11571_cov_33_434805_g166_i0NODE_193_length_11571_cov_33_434805_g166_i0_p1_ORF_typecomplete_len1051_score268_12_NODE_193_length_11571_cov_33_434805_g166_i068209972
MLRPIGEEQGATSSNVLATSFRDFTQHQMTQEDHSKESTRPRASQSKIAQGFQDYERRLFNELALSRAIAALDLTAGDKKSTSFRQDSASDAGEENGSVLQQSQEVLESPLYQNVMVAFSRNAHANGGQALKEVINKTCQLICTFKYERIPPLEPLDEFDNPYLETIFEFDEEDVPKPLDWPSFKLPFGARLARVDEVEKSPDLFKGLLQNFEMTMLQDGILCGPSYGYRLQRHFLSSFQLSSAIVAIPEIHELTIEPLDVRLLLLFKYFDKDDQAALSEIESLVWMAFAGVEVKKLFYNEDHIGWWLKLSLPDRGTHSRLARLKRLASGVHSSNKVDIERVYAKLPPEILKITDQDTFAPNYLLCPTNLLRRLCNSTRGPALSEWSDFAEFFHHGLGIQLPAGLDVGAREFRLFFHRVYDLGWPWPLNESEGSRIITDAPTLFAASNEGIDGWVSNVFNRAFKPKPVVSDKPPTQLLSWNTSLDDPPGPDAQTKTSLLTSTVSLAPSLICLFLGGHGFPVMAGHLVGQVRNSSNILKAISQDDGRPCAVCQTDMLGTVTSKSSELDHEVFRQLAEIFYALKHMEETEEFEKIETLFTSFQDLTQLVVKTQTEMLCPLFGRHITANALLYLATSQGSRGVSIRSEDLLRRASDLRHSRLSTAGYAKSTADYVRALSGEFDETAMEPTPESAHAQQSVEEIERWQQYIRMSDQKAALKAIPKNLRGALNVFGSHNLISRSAGDRSDFMQLMKHVHLDLLEEFHKTYLKLFLKSFDITKLKTKVNTFYDTDYIRFIQWKVRTILSPQFPIHPTDLHPSSRVLLEPNCRDIFTNRRKAAPTAYLVLKDLRRFRFSIVHDTSVLTSSAKDHASLIKQLLNVLDSPIFLERTAATEELKTDIQTTILLRILLNARVIHEDDFVEVHVPVTTLQPNRKKTVDQSRGNFIRVIRPTALSAVQFYRRLILTLLNVQTTRTKISAPLVKELVKTSYSSQKTLVATGKFRNSRTASTKLTTVEDMMTSSTTVGMTDEYLEPYFSIAEYLVTNYLWLDGGC